MNKSPRHNLFSKPALRGLGFENVSVAFSLLLSLLFVVLFTGCIQDKISSSPSDQPQFSTEVLDFGTVFTDSPSATSYFKVYNRHNKVMAISSISLGKGSQSVFRMNVDGQAGSRFNNIQIRPNDSIYVFVELTVPEKLAPASDPWKPFTENDYVNFVTNGVTKAVKVEATAQKVEVVKDLTLASSTTWSGHPRRVFGALQIPEGVQLTINQGVSVYFHEGASVEVKGRLVTQGVSSGEKQSGFVTFRGDRLDNVVKDVPFEYLASQWQGINVDKTGSVKFSHTDFMGTKTGLTATGDASTHPTIELVNSRLHRSGADLITVTDGVLKVIGCELSDSKGSLISVAGGELTVNQSSLMNSYISSGIVGPLMKFDEGSAPVKAQITNSILKNYRSGGYILPADISELDVKYEYTLIDVSGSDDNNFINCIWKKNPLTKVNIKDYIFDYQLQGDSPAIDAGDGKLVNPLTRVDMYGVKRHEPSPTLGAYEYVKQ